VQVSGRKGWRLRPPRECAGAGAVCDGHEQYVLVSPGEMLCLSIDRLRHATVLVPEEQDEERSPDVLLNVDVAWDLHLSEEGAAQENHLAHPHPGVRKDEL
jgi:hypothetical protein